MKICPNDSDHNEFIATGVEYHEWLVSANGSFIDDRGCHSSRLGEDEWQCAICQATAIDKPQTIDPNQWAFDNNLESF